jgi:hypothetical protein
MPLTPDARELLAIANATFSEEILPMLEGSSRHSGLMVRNALGIALRMLDVSDPLSASLVNAMAARLRSGECQPGTEEGARLHALLREHVRAKVAVTNPKYLAQ